MSSTFTPTSAELALVNQIFAQADTQKIGILTGDVAVKLFSGAKLTATVLGDIWAIADDDDNGFLTRKGAAVVVRLMGWAQKGVRVSLTMLKKPGPLPTIEGVFVPSVPGMSMLESPPPGLPVLTPQDKAKFNRIFQGCQPVSGLLSGEKVHDIFVMSRLSVEKLSQIWTLADTRDRCAFDSTDFTIAMYFIQAAMSGQLSSIPTSLPPGLYQQAGGGDVVHGTNSASAHLGSPGTSSFPAAVRQLPVQTNHTGQPSTAPALPSRRPGLAGQITETLPSPDVAPQETGQWDITPVGKARADRFFDILDSQKRGYIEGNVAVPFMLQSRLPKEALAQVWDLADVNNEGRLTRDEFAIAMYLIQAKISGEEIPMTLPSSLVPPSMRLDDPSVRFLQSFEVDGINDVEGDAGIYEAAHEYYLAALEMDADLWSSRPTTPQPFSFSSSQSSTSPRAPQSSTSASPSNIARPADTMRSGLCVVCQDEEADVAVVDCGHLAMCRTCSDLVWASSRKCPLCRTRIATEARLLRIFKT